MMTISRRRILLLSFFVLLVIVIASVVVYQASIASPPNILWALFSGYYRYDPRQQNPPKGLFLDRPEDSLTYFFDSTLKVCGGTYPPLSNAKVIRYEVEEVEYLGHTDYHAFSLLHTRIYFADGRSVRVMFRFEAGHNESYPLFIIDTATIRTASWISLSGLLRDPDVEPPGWSRYDIDGRPYVCNPGPPDAIEEPWS